MKILLTASPLYPVPPVTYGGVERIVASLAVNLQRLGHIVGLVAHPESTATTDYFSAFPCVWPTKPAQHLQNLMRLRRDISEFSPDIVHSFSRLFYLLPQMRQNLPKVHSYQLPPGRRQVRAAARIAGGSLSFTGCSEFIAGMGRAHGGAWHAVPNFVDVEAFPFSETVPSDAPLVFLSRIESIKGAHIAIETAKKCGRRLIVAGNHAAEGPEQDYWTACIKPELGRNGIDYVGPVDDRAKMELLGSAAAMIVPIQWDEPFGIVFAEALACGTPVISCPRGALPEIVRDGVEGFLVRDAEEACRAVASITAIDRRQCRARAEQAFSAAAVVPRYETLYRAMVEHV